MVFTHPKAESSTKQTHLWDLFYKGKAYEIFVPQLHDKDRCGSSKGWLVYEDSKVHLFNPFLPGDNKIDLPRIAPGIGYDLGLDRLSLVPVQIPVNIDGSIHKVVLSANPASDPNFVAIAIYGDFRSLLAFYKPGNKAWTLLDTGGNPIDDVIYYRDQVYAVDMFGRTWVFDLKSPESGDFLCVKGTDENDSSASYIVESAEELLIVNVWMDEDENDTDSCNFRFKVYKLNQAALEWTEVKSLFGQVLFLGDNSSISLLASDFSGLKPNCIYYAFGFNRVNKRGVAVYDLENGNTLAFHLKDPKLFFPSAPIWIEPTLRGYSN